MNQRRVSRLAVLAGVAAVLAALGLPARGADYDYDFKFETGGTPPFQLLPTGSWADAGHWTGRVLPGGGDTVLVKLPKTYQYVDGDGQPVTETLTAAELNHDPGSGNNTIGAIGAANQAAIRLSGGRLTLLGDSELNAAYTQTGGILDGPGNLVINGAAVFYGGTMAGTGTTRLSAAARSAYGLDLAGQRVLENRDTLDLQNGSAITSNDGSGTLNNAVTGTVRNLETGTVAQIGATFNNSGVTEVGSGATLRLLGGGVHGGVFQGAGLVEFAGGTHTLVDRPGGVTLNNVNVATTLSAAMDYGITGKVGFYGGSLRGVGTTTLTGTAQDIYGVDLNGSRVLENRGSFDFKGDYARVGSSDGTGSFVNRGLITRTAPAGTAAIDVTFDNRGTVDLAAGSVLQLNRGGTHSGVFQGDGVVEFAGGTHTLSDRPGGVTLNNVNIGGTLSAAIDYRITGRLGLHGGTLDGAGTTVMTGTVADIWGLNLTGGRALENRGTFDLAGDWASVGSTDGTGSFVNSGRITRTVTTGAATIGVAFDNDGIVELGAGTVLRLNGGGTHGGVFQGDGVVEFAGGTNTLLNRLGGVTLNNVNLGGTLNAAMDYRIIGGVGLYGGTLNGKGTTVLTGTAIDVYGVNLTGGRHLENRGTFEITGEWAGVGSSDGTGTFVNQGRVTRTAATGTAGIGVGFDNRGTVEVLGGKLQVYNPAVDFTNHGTIHTAAGATLESDDLTNASDGSLTGTGTINLGSGTLNNAGVIAPGASPGTLTIDGNLTLTDTSDLRIELASLTDFDRLMVSGQVVLGGRLDLYIVDGYLPSLGDWFDILFFNDLTGAFAAVDLTGLDPRLTVSVAPLSDRLRLSIVAADPSVPAPPVTWLLLTGAAGWRLVRRRGRPAGRNRSSEDSQILLAVVLDSGQRLDTGV